MGAFKWTPREQEEKRKIGVFLDEKNTFLPAFYV